MKTFVTSVVEPMIDVDSGHFIKWLTESNKGKVQTIQALFSVLEVDDDFLAGNEDIRTALLDARAHPVILNLQKRSFAGTTAK